MKQIIPLFLIVVFFISSCQPLATSRKQLTKEEQARLDEVERKHGEGELTETEYQIEKESVMRKKVVTF